MSMPPPTPSPPITAQSVATSPGPSRKWYLIPVVLLLLIGAPAIFTLVKGLTDLSSGLTRVLVPGQSTVMLGEGEYLVFHEWRGEFKGKSFVNYAEFPGMTAVLVAEDGEEIPVTSPDTEFSYSFDDKAGYPVGQFEVDEPGEYVFSAHLTDTTNTQEFVLAFGNPGRATFMGVLGIIGALAAGGFAFFVWLIIFILRYRAKNRMASAGFSPS